jgi:hypothetical protein
MKRIVSLLLAAVLLLGLGVTVFAAGSPTGGNGQPKGPVKKGMGIYNAEDERIALVPPGQVKKTAVGNAKRLSDADREAFLAAYEEVKKIEDKKVKYFFWLDIPEKYKNMEDFSYAKYEFTCTGKNVQLTVNGKEMEVEKTGKNTYFAKLTEFGAIAILCD